MTRTLGRPRPPAHLWVVGILGLLWSGFGAFDYVLINIRHPEYLSQFPAEIVQMFDEFPIWVMAAWALGVWGAVAGSLLLLARSRFAVPAFAVSLGGLALTSIHQATADIPEALETTAMTAMNIAIWAAAVFFLIYAWRMRSRCVLR